jgi:6-phosphogluconolactonase
MRSLALFCYFLAVLLLAACQPHRPVTYLFTGAYTEGEAAPGLHVYRFDAGTGRLNPCSHVPDLVNPSFLRLSADGRFLYACTESRLPREGSISAFAFDPVSGRLTPLNKQPSGGQNPVFLALHPGGKWLLAANYTTPVLSAFPILADGSLGPRTDTLHLTGSGPVVGRQETSHPHCVVFAPDGRYAFVPDLGGDQIHVLRVADSAARLERLPELTVHSQSGSGPRHFAFHPSGRFAYCNEELSGYVTAFSYADGRLHSVQRIFAYSQQMAQYGGADLHLSPDGCYLYCSNRVPPENSIACFAVDSLSGRLRLVAHFSTLGDHPRSFCLSPDGDFLVVANQESGDIIVFRRDEDSGLLTPVRQRVRMRLPASVQMRSYMP